MKRFFCIVSAFLSFMFLKAQSPSIRLGMLTDISCLPCAYLIENRAKLAVQDMDFELFTSVQTELEKMLRGEIDMGFLFPQDAAKVFSKGKGALLCAGVVQNGSLYLLTSDQSYSSLQDLRGKKILCQGFSGSAGERTDSLIFKYLLSKKEIPVDEGENPVSLDFSLPTANIANALITKTADYALLSEPYASVALKNSKELRRSENIQKIYNESEEWSTFPAMLLVVRSDFAKDKAELVRRFIEVYKHALTWTINNPSKSSLLVRKHNPGLSELVVRRAIPNASLTWRDAKSARADIEKYLVILGREIPSEDFYF